MLVMVFPEMSSVQSFQGIDVQRIAASRAEIHCIARIDRPSSPGEIVGESGAVLAGQTEDVRSAAGNIQLRTARIPQCVLGAEIL
jgi:hypothetical protein